MTESTLILAFLLAALFPLLATPGKTIHSTRTTRRAIVGLWAGVAVLMIAAVARTPSQQISEASAIEHRPVEILVDGYVGSNACRSCHPHNHATWFSSYHRTMTQAATPQSVIGDLDSAEFSQGGSRLRMYRENDGYFVESESPGGMIQRARVSMTTGSHHMQVYWISPSEQSRNLALLNYVYLKDDHRWIPRHAAFLTLEKTGLIGGDGRWNSTCIKCHTTHGRLMPTEFGPRGTYNPQSVDTQAVEFGISCESCHGPARQHVLANQNPVRRYGQHLKDAPDPTIVNPARLSPKRSAQVCGQCHAVMHDRAGQTRHWAEHGYDYRPGADLEDSSMRFLVGGDLESIPADERSQFVKQEDILPNTFWSDGMIRVSGAEYNGLRASPCFQRGEMTCLSCHEMHPGRDDQRAWSEWADDQLKPGMRGNLACYQCHEELQSPAALTAHTHHEASSSGSNCYNCHASHTTYGLLKAIRTHEINSPSVLDAVQTGRPHACNQCHLDRTLGWTADHLAEWYGMDRPELEADDEQIAASILWLLKGDAAQRALMAWSYGWSDAMEVSGRDWQAPFLAQLLEDPYPAVRLIAHRSLRKLPGFEALDFEIDGASAHRLEVKEQIIETWAGRQGGDRERLLMPGGKLDRATFERLLKQRDNRIVDLRE